MQPGEPADALSACVAAHSSRTGLFLMPSRRQHLAHVKCFWAIRKGRAEEWPWDSSDPHFTTLGLNSGLSRSRQHLCPSLTWFCLGEVQSCHYHCLPLLWTLKVTGFVLQSLIHPFPNHSVFIEPLLRTYQPCPMSITFHN